jgi:hypothetical protein
MGLNLYHTLLFTGQFIITLSAAAQWLPVGTGGNAYSIETHNGALFAGNLGGAIQRSTDHGDTWTETNTGITAASNWWLSSAQGILFCGTQFGAAFRSTDDGTTWENIGLLGAARGFIEHNDTLYACQWYSGGVDYSTDGGATWQDTDTLIGANGLLAHDLCERRPARWWANGRRAPHHA